MSGTVYLVGAGPGSLDLLTVRAAELIASADVIVYDRLIGADVLRTCRSGVDLIDVSKRPGDLAETQDAINALLVSSAQTNREVVRLKGGDPFVFGRGGEEALALRAAGVPFEVIPGISSALAAPAAAGIPVTHRELSRSLTIITGHAGALDGHNWDALAASDTLVVLMGAATLLEIVQRLLGTGLASSTPAAAIENATLPTQHEVRSVLSELADAVRAAGLRAPLVVIVGAVAAFDVRSLSLNKALFA